MRGTRRFSAALVALLVTAALLAMYVFSSMPVNRSPVREPSPVPTIVDPAEVI